MKKLLATCLVLATISLSGCCVCKVAGEVAGTAVGVAGSAIKAAAHTI